MNILILGIGNVLMGDEGVGVHAINYLDKEPSFADENIHFLDGGTGGFHLLEYLQNYSTVIMIDATMDGKPAGTVRLIKPKFSKDFPKTLSAHDIGLKDLVESAALLNHHPEIFLITVSIDEIQNMEIHLSDSVQSALPEISSQVTQLLQALLTAECLPHAGVPA
jgi:hydrogenase maturation protease